MSKIPAAFRGSFKGYYQLYKDDGTLDPIAYPTNNLTDLEVTPDADEVEVVSTENDDFGQAVDSMVDAKPTKVKFSINRHNIDTMALANMGEATKRTAIQKTVTDEPVTFVLGELLRLANLDISALTLTNASGITTYAAGTDYEIVDAQLGLIRPLVSGTIVDNSAGLADYTAAAESGWKISGGTKPGRFIKLYGRGVNRFNNKRGILEIEKMSIKPSGGMSQVGGKDPATQGFEGTVVVPADGSAGWSFIVAA